MNIYERIVNILLEARVEMFIQDRLDERNKGNREAVRAWQAKQGKTPADPKTKEDRLRIGRQHLDKGEGQRTPAQVATDAQIARQINKGKIKPKG
jgi:hypothetical protein